MFTHPLIMTVIRGLKKKIKIKTDSSGNSNFLSSKHNL